MVAHLLGVGASRVVDELAVLQRTQPPGSIGNAQQVLAAIAGGGSTLVGGQPLSEMIEGQARFPISIRLPEKLRNDPETLKELVLRAPGSELGRS